MRFFFASRPRKGSPDLKTAGGRKRVAPSKAVGTGIVALRRAILLDRTSVVRIGGRRVAIVPLLRHPRLERFLGQEAQEKELDRLDVAEAERRLSDPTEVSIPYEQVRRELGLGELPD